MSNIPAIKLAYTFLDVGQRNVRFEDSSATTTRNAGSSSAAQHDSMVVLPDPGAPEKTMVRRARTLSEKGRSARVEWERTLVERKRAILEVVANSCCEGHEGRFMWLRQA